MQQVVQRNWDAGVITAQRGDELPANAAQVGQDSALYYTQQGKAFPGIRQGLTRYTDTPPDAAYSGIHSIHELRLSAGTNPVLAIDVLGQLWKCATTGASTLLGTLSNAGRYPAQWQTARDLAFFVNEKESGCTDGTSLFSFAPDSPTALADTGSAVAGDMSGVYEIALTGYSSTYGHETSRTASVSTGTLASKNIVITWTDPTDTRLSHVRVYIRKGTLGTAFLLAASVAIGVETATLNISDAAYANLITEAPGVAENDPPPSSLVSLALYGQRMLVATDDKIYPSQLNKPMAFNLEDGQVVGIEKDADPIIRLLPFNAQILLVIRRDSVMMISGNDPATWQVEILDPSRGSRAPLSAFVDSGKALWWHHEQGPLVWDGTTSPMPIGLARIGDIIGNVNPTQEQDVWGIADPSHERWLWAIPSGGNTRLDTILPYSTRLGVWESSEWYTLDACALGRVDGTDGRRKVMLGGYAGRVWYFSDGTTDGATATYTLAGTATAYTANTLTDSTATFDIAGSGLQDCWVEAVSSSGITERQRITSNTATQVTCEGNWSIVPVTYTIATPHFIWETAWADEGLPFDKKRYGLLWGEGFSNTTDTFPTIAFYTDWETLAKRTATFTQAAGVYGGLVTIIDEVTFIYTMGLQAKFRAACTGKVWKFKVEVCQKLAQFVLTKLGAQVFPRSDRG